MNTLNSNTKFMLIGEIEAGKTSLLNALFNKNEAARKTQALEYEGCEGYAGCGVDTPGEYFSHPRYYSALINTASDASTLVYVHAADREACRLPPGFLDIYAGKTVIGVITKTDLPDARTDAVEALLRAHGIAGPIFRTSTADPASLHALRQMLLGQTTCHGASE
jgi:ethanolamine utilization protein EutP